MTIKNKLELQKVLMVNSVVAGDPDSGWWEVNSLTPIMRRECAKHSLRSINHSTVERNIRHFRDPKHFLDVEKRKVSDNTWEYRVTHKSDSHRQLDLAV